MIFRIAIIFIGKAINEPLYQLISMHSIFRIFVLIVYETL